MKKINLFFKGILIGLGKIIPGVSGSVIAISLGLYENIIDSISTIYKNTKEKIKFLLPIFIGIAISIILGSRIILYFLNKCYFITMMFFIGLMSGGINPIFKQIKDKQSKKNIMIMIIPIIFFLILDILIKKVNIEIKFNYISIFLLGIVEAIASLVPGISGSAIMMMLGVYDKILLILTSYAYIDKIIFFILGIVIGVIIISKLINYYLTNYKVESYYAIFSFCIFSIFIVFKNLLEIDLTFSNLLSGLILCYIGYLITSKMN